MQPKISCLLCITLIVTSVFSFFIQPAAAQSNTYYRFSPTAIYNDGQDVTTLEIFTSGANISRVIIKPEYASDPVYELFDNGMNGDRTAGDGTYTLGGIDSAMYPDELKWAMMYGENGEKFDLGTIWLSAEIIYTSGQTDSHFMGLNIVAPYIAFPAEQVGKGLYATEYAFFIVDSIGETYTGSYPHISDFNSPAITKKFYSIYPDEFDFINFQMIGGDLDIKAHSAGLQSPAQNIGIDTPDYFTEYGSKGRLLSMTYSDFRLLNHEIGHTWAAFLGSDQGISNGAHWADNTDIAGIMSEGFATPDGLYFFIPHGDGTFKAGWQSVEYVPLELYLMGLLSPDEVPDIHILHNPNLSDLERVTAQQVDLYTIEDLMALAGGPRQPAYPQTQTEFNLAYILLSESALSPAEYAWYTYHARCYMAKNICGESNFYTATGGRGMVNTRLADWGIPSIPTITPKPTVSYFPTQTPTPKPIATHQLNTQENDKSASGRPVWNSNLPCVSGFIPLYVLGIILTKRKKN